MFQKSQKIFLAYPITRDNNVCVLFKPTECLVKTLQGRTLLRGVIDHGLYRISSLSSTSALSSSPITHVSSRTSLEERHRRLAHSHKSILRRLVSSFYLPVSSNKLLFLCEACQLGKSRRLHLSHVHQHSQNLFELIYSNVWGPSSSLSPFGSRYFVLFIDDATHFVWISFLSQKSDIYKTFVNFHSMIKTQFGTSIKCVQSDWGGKYRPL